MSLARIPVLLFGQTAQVGAMVAKQLQPEFEGPSIRIAQPAQKEYKVGRS